STRARAARTRRPTTRRFGASSRPPARLELQAVAQPQIVGGLGIELEAEGAAERVVRRAGAGVVAAGEAEIAEQRVAVEQVPGEAGIAAVARDLVEAQAELRPRRERKRKTPLSGELSAISRLSLPSAGAAPRRVGSLSR